MVHLLTSPFLESVDFSYNPVKGKSMQNVCKVLPLCQIRYLSLSYIRMSQETLELLQTATDQTRADSCLLLKHLNLEQTCRSQMQFNVHTVHYTDRVKTEGLTIDECVNCSNYRLVTLQAETGDRVVVTCERIHSQKEY